MKYILLLYVFIWKIYFGYMSEKESNPCAQHSTCGDCIRAAHRCLWCNKVNITYNCQPANSVTDCEPNLIENPKSSKVKDEARQFSSNIDDIVQLVPQGMTINIRPGDSVKFPVSYKLADNYPVDLYFLIDVSDSMTLMKNLLVETCGTIFKDMTALTKNVYLGMGSFVDKNALPYAREINSKKTYSFEHRLKMTQDVTEFSKTVKETPLGSNYDDDEGGLDGLAQVLVSEEIGWRNLSTKIVLFITDEKSHSAGDGKWAGITRPYDGHSYLQNGKYTKELKMDYPSLGIIDWLAQKKGIVPVFVIKNNNKDHYSSYKEVIRNARVVSFEYKDNTIKFNDDDAMSLSRVLTEIYMSITSNFQFDFEIDTEIKKYFSISLDPDCLSQSCESTINEIVEFQATIKLSESYSKNETFASLGIKSIDEKVNLKINQLKDCDCEKNVLTEPTYCNGNGKLICGRCQCNNAWIGDQCECSTNATNDDSAGCRAPGSKDKCSNNGFCNCGRCSCLDGYDGQFCECSSLDCPNMCSHNGYCSCSKCICNDGWKLGDHNDCSCSEASCPSIDGKVCGGRGECECAECQCQRIDTEWDARHSHDENCYIQPCSECHAAQCLLLQTCALCMRTNDTVCTSSCHKNIAIKVVDKYEDTNDTEVFTCANVKSSFQCNTQFHYRYKKHVYEIELIVETNSDCLESFLVPTCVIVFVLFAIGIGTLIAWKILTEKRDRAEYERFIKENGVGAESSRDNPLYSGPSTNIINPAFRRRSCSEN